MKYSQLLITICCMILLGSCESLIPPAPEESELLDGPMTELTPAQNRQFLAGDIAFNDEVFTALNGLGPLFVATSCGSCHAGDGKGHPFTTLTRFGQTAPDTPHQSPGAPQLQHRALPGFDPERIPEGKPYMNFTPPAVTGLGLLSAITDAQILDNADPDDLNNDGISGVPNYVSPPPYFEQQWFHSPLNGKIIGRFGKKAAAVDLLHQTVSAYNQDMGITSTFEPTDTYTGLTLDPEVSDKTVRDVVFTCEHSRRLSPETLRSRSSHPDEKFSKTSIVQAAISPNGGHPPQISKPYPTSFLSLYRPTPTRHGP